MCCHSPRPAAQTDCQTRNCTRAAQPPSDSASVKPAMPWDGTSLASNRVRRNGAGQEASSNPQTAGGRWLFRTEKGIFGQILHYRRMRRQRCLANAHAYRVSVTAAKPSKDSFSAPSKGLGDRMIPVRSQLVAAARTKPAMSLAGSARVVIGSATLTHSNFLNRTA